FGNDRVTETDDEDAHVVKATAQPEGGPGLSYDDGHDRRVAFDRTIPEPPEPAPEMAGVLLQATDALRLPLQDLEGRERARRNGRRRRVGEELRPGPLDEVVDDRPRPGHEAACGPAERF